MQGVGWDIQVHHDQAKIESNDVVLRVLLYPKKVCSNIFSVIFFCLSSNTNTVSAIVHKYMRQQLGYVLFNNYYVLLEKSMTSI